MIDTGALLAALIRAQSPDPPGDERAVAGVLAGALRDLGLDPRVEEFAPRRFNVTARLVGRAPGPGLVFSAHMDTLPVGTGVWRHDPFAAVVEGGRIFGRGACDMKSGLVAMVAAAVEVAGAGGPARGDLVLAFTGGESSSCLGAKRLVAQGALRDCDAILVSEPTSLDVVTAEKGALWLRATARGRAGHLSGGPVDSAILRMLAVLPGLSAGLPGDVHPLLGQATLTIGTIAGGTAINLVPDLCTADLDLRFLPGQDPDALTDALAAPGLGIERLDLKPPVETPVDDPFVRLCLAQAARLRGVPLSPRGVAYFSDACVLAPAFGLSMVIIGPGMLGGSGAVDESCALSDVDLAARIFARIARARLG